MRAVALLAAMLLVAPAAAQVVTIDSGQIRGTTEGASTAWKGIPFAAPPIGANRWRAPQPARRWPGVRDAGTYGSDCMQTPFPSDAAPLGTAPAEDCLVANVWAPSGARAGQKRPVIVWIHGGGFVNGGSSPAVYSGANFARDGVVFVSFNSRLGRFGFVAHPALRAAAEGPQGNFGYMDQLAAIRWVARNVAAFGGDPANVTLMGESAGGQSVLTMLMAPSARGLFARAIVMSGGGRGPLTGMRDVATDRADTPSGETIGLAFARRAGIDGTDATALTRLRALPADRVVDGLSMIALFQPPPGERTYVGGPMRDGQIVTGTPGQSFEAGIQAPVPVMIGTTSADIGFSTAATKDELFAPFGANAAAARRAYDPDGTIPLKALGATIAADRGMTEPARYAAEEISNAGQSAYLYRFSYVAEALRSTQPAGATHASDIPFAFDTVAVKYGTALSRRDRNAARVFHDRIVAFAKNGSPNDAGSPLWKPFDRRRAFLLDFDQSGSATGGADPWETRLDLIAKAAR